MSSSNGSAPTANRGLTIQGIDGLVNVPAGEFITNPKARIRRMMKNHLSRNARRVHARLDLATMGFHQELAVVMDKGRIRPLTTGDISKDAEMNEGDVRRALDELDAAGLGERRAVDSGKLRKGKVEIYSWAFPRPPKEEKSVCAHTEKLRWIPEDLKPLLAYANRCRYKLSDDLDEHARTLLLERGPEIARILEEADKAAARLLDEVCAKEPLYKEEKTERTKEKEPPPPASSNGHVHVVEEDEELQVIEAQLEPLPPAETLPAVRAKDAEPVPTFDEFRAVYPGEVDPKSKGEYVKLKPAEKIACVRSLFGYRECGRWKAQNGKFIPMASRFIRDEYWKFKPPDDRAPQDPKMAKLEASVNATRAFARAFRSKT